MSTTAQVEPTEEQKQAARNFYGLKEHLSLSRELARLLAEREAKLRAKIDTLEQSEHDVHVAIYECLTRAPAMGVRLHIDGEPDRMARDVVDWVKAATKVLEGRDVVSLATFHRIEAERDTLRARVAELEAFTLLTDGQRTAEMFAADLAVVTRAVREADQLHQTVGGGTRHYVNECLLPCLKDEGFAIIVVGKAHYDDAKAAEGGEG